MFRRPLLLLVLLLALNLGISSFAFANGITGLFNTGLSASGTALADGASDPHYLLVSTPAGATSVAPFVTLQKSPIQSGGWMLDSGTSKWISHTANESTGPEAPGDYVYQTTFTVSGNPNSVIVSGQVAIDSVLKAIVVNGITLPNMPDGTLLASNFNSWNTFLLSSGFVSGTNILQFVVTRTGTSNNPSGFRCEFNTSALPNYHPLPAWAQGVTPTDSGGVGAGPSSADLVYLASGLYENHPGADIGARNPVGSSPIFARTYSVVNAYQGYGSPGLPAGWTHNYDVVVVPGATTSAVVTLYYPNGAMEIWNPGTPMATPCRSHPLRERPIW